VNFIDLPIPHPFPIPTGPVGDACAAADCYEQEMTADRQIKVWSSRYPENGSVVFDLDEYADFIRRVQADADGTYAAIVAEAEAKAPTA
jgi:hypothetical protein